jgi:hypothetical protein
VCICYLAQLLAVNGGSSLLEMFEPDVNSEPSKIPSSIAHSVEVFAEESIRSMDSVVLDLDVEVPPLPDKSAKTTRRTFILNIYRTKPNSDPLAPLSFSLSDGVLVFRSQPLHTNHPLWWRQLSFRIDRLCRGDFWRPIVVELVEIPETPTSRFVTSFSYSDLMRSLTEGPFVLRFNDPRTTVSVRCRDIVHDFSFLDFVSAGLEIAVIVGIDFTRSNEDPRIPSSLHAFDSSTGQPGPSNEYVMVMKSVLEILEHYDSDKKFPVFGFGAKLPPSKTTTSHCFSCSGDYFAPEVFGVDGVLEAYRNALGTVNLHGPTKFSDLLSLARQYAAPSHESEVKYFVLLIITDGVIEDLQQSVDEIVELAQLPVSIVIVGVGSENFSQMVLLDADENPLYSSKTGSRMSRDIVQFVPFQDFKDRPYHELAVATLEEIPREVLRFFKGQGIHPVINPDTEERKRRYLGFADSSGRILRGPQQARNDKGDEENGLDKFFSDSQTELINTVVRQGYAEELVRRVVDQGILCPDPLHVIDLMFHVQKTAPTGPPRISSNGIISIAERMHVADSLVRQDAGMDEKRSPTKTPRSGMFMGRIGRLCGICMQHEIDLVIKPCGHEVICQKCFSQLASPVCPLCRATVSGFQLIT